MTRRPIVLIIDDEPRWQARLIRLLGNEDYVIETASTLEEAAQKLVSTSYAAIVTDLDLEHETKPTEFEGLGILDGHLFLERIGQTQGRSLF